MISGRWRSRSATSARATGSRTTRRCSSRPCGRSCASGWPRPGCRAWRPRASCIRSSCRRWPAPRRCSPRSPAGRDVTWAALVLNRKGLDRAVAAGAEEIHVAYPVTETFARRNQNMGRRGGGDGRGGDHRRRPRGRPARHRDAGRLVRLPVRGPGRPRRGRRPRAPDGGRRRGRCSPTRSASACPARSSGCCDAWTSTCPVGLHLHNTRNTGYANAYAGLEAGRDAVRRLGRRARRLPVRAARDRQHRHRGPALPARGRGRRHRRRPRRRDRVAEWLSGVLGRPLPGLVHRADRF